MAKNVIGLFDNASDAQEAVRGLESLNLDGGQVSLLQQSSGQTTNTFEQLGLPQDDAAAYIDGIQNGGTVVVVQQLGDDEAQRAADILNRYNIVDINSRMRSSGTTATSTQRMEDVQTNSAAVSGGLRSDTAASGSYSNSTRQRGTYEGGERVIPIVEEEIRIGKREVDEGGVRVRTTVEERPVNEQVTLRDEEVHVERRRVDRPVDATAATDAFQEGTFEVREHDEEAVVQKEARVVEEVVINKEAQDRTETVQDTVRRTNVNVEELPAEARATDVTATTTSRTTRSGSEDEGPIERGLSKAENAVERGTGLDLDRDHDVGQRDPRNNI